MVDDHLCPHQPQPEAQCRTRQVVPAKVGWLVGIVSTTPRDGDAGDRVAWAPLAAPMDSPAGYTAQHNTAWSDTAKNTAQHMFQRRSGRFVPHAVGTVYTSHTLVDCPCNSTCSRPHTTHCNRIKSLSASQHPNTKHQIQHPARPLLPTCVCEQQCCPRLCRQCTNALVGLPHNSV